VISLAAANLSNAQIVTSETRAAQLLDEAFQIDVGVFVLGTTTKASLACHRGATAFDSPMILVNKIDEVLATPHLNSKVHDNEIRHASSINIGARSLNTNNNFILK
jgi:hypothetical protein